MFEWIFLWLIISQFVKFVVFIALLHKKSVVNSKLKIMIEKKRNNEMGEDVRGEIKLIRITNLVKSDMIWYVGEDIFYYFLGVKGVHVLKWESFFFFW